MSYLPVGDSARRLAESGEIVLGGKGEEFV